jgi:hypothetical protein
MGETRGQVPCGGFPPLQRIRIVELACLAPVARGLQITHWSSQDLARKAIADGIVEAISPRTVRLILDRVDLQPHRTRYCRPTRLDPGSRPAPRRNSGTAGMPSGRSGAAIGIAGLLSAVAAFAALGLSIGRSQLGPPLGLMLSIVLFGCRYAIKTGQFIPSGLLAVISRVVLGVMILTID